MLWLLAVDLANENFWRLKEISIFSLSTWNLYLRDIIFVTDVSVPTIETIKLTNHFLKPLDIFMTLLSLAKKVRLRQR